MQVDFQGYPSHYFKTTDPLEPFNWMTQMMELCVICSVCPQTEGIKCIIRDGYEKC